MKQFRKIIFWCHLVTGVAVAIVVVVMSVTGVLLTYQRQLTAWADTRGLDGGPPMPDAQPLPIEELLLRLEQADFGAPTSITWQAGGQAPVAVAYGRERTLFVNAFTGAVLSEGSQGVRAFFRTVTDWHRWLGASGDNRSVGRAVTGACNLGFLFLVVSGFYLWWPRNWTRNVLRNVTFFRRGLSPKARNFNWHNVIGFWSLAPLLLIVASGVVISYPWASDLVYQIAGEPPPAGRGPGGGPGRPAPAPETGPEALVLTPTPDFLALDHLRDRAARQLPDWRSLSLQIPAAADSTVTFALDGGTGGQPQKRAQLTLRRTTGEQLRWEPFEAGSPGRRLRSILRFAHTGEVLGLAGQTLAGIVSLGVVLLVWTGLALSLRRFRSWQTRQTYKTPRKISSETRQAP